MIVQAFGAALSRIIDRDGCFWQRVIAVALIAMLHPRDLEAPVAAGLRTKLASSTGILLLVLQQPKMRCLLTRLAAVDEATEIKGLAVCVDGGCAENGQ